MNKNVLRQQMIKKFSKKKIWTGSHPCGTGSIFENTKLTRDFLASIVKKYDIHTIADAGAGDLSWITATEWPHPVQYTPYDIYVRHPDVIQFDITSQVLPTVDLILCRHVINHLPGPLIADTLENFSKSGSNYILLAILASAKHNFTALWGESLEEVSEKAMNGKDWVYCLWKLV